MGGSSPSVSVIRRSVQHLSLLAKTDRGSSNVQMLGIISSFPKVFVGRAMIGCPDWVIMVKNPANDFVHDLRKAQMSTVDMIKHHTSTAFKISQYVQHTTHYVSK